MATTKNPVQTKSFIGFVKHLQGLGLVRNALLPGQKQETPIGTNTLFDFFSEKHGAIGLVIRPRLTPANLKIAQEIFAKAAEIAKADPVCAKYVYSSTRIGEDMTDMTSLRDKAMNY